MSELSLLSGRGASKELRVRGQRRRLIGRGRAVAGISGESYLPGVRSLEILELFTPEQPVLGRPTLIAMRGSVRHVLSASSGPESAAQAIAWLRAQRL